MKKLLAFTIALTGLLVISACAADNEDSSEDQQHNTDIESVEVMSQEDMSDKMDKLNYIVYDFDVLYKDSEFEGEIENDEGLIEAEYYNPFEDIQARGAEAFDALFPILEKLNLSEEMSDEEAIAESLAAFNLPENYLKAQLEVVFSDGTEKLYELKK